MLNTFARPEVSMNWRFSRRGGSAGGGKYRPGNPEKDIGKTGNLPWPETEVRISEQMPAGESTGVDVPGQLWKRYHMEKASITANLNTAVEMGMSHGEDTVQNLFTYFAGGLVQNIPDRLQDGFVKRELPAGEYIVCRVEAEKF